MDVQIVSLDATNIALKSIAYLAHRSCYSGLKMRVFMQKVIKPCSWGTDIMSGTRNASPAEVTGNCAHTGGRSNGSSSFSFIKIPEYFISLEFS